jgi:UDPglucose 6-dehydrogenase
MSNARERHPQLEYVEDVADALTGAELTVLVTERSEYRVSTPLPRLDSWAVRS